MVKLQLVYHIWNYIEVNSYWKHVNSYGGVCELLLFIFAVAVAVVVIIPRTYLSIYLDKYALVRAYLWCVPFWIHSKCIRLFTFAFQADHMHNFGCCAHFEYECKHWNVEMFIHLLGPSLQGVKVIRAKWFQLHCIGFWAPRMDGVCKCLNIKVDVFSLASVR